MATPAIRLPKDVYKRQANGRPHIGHIETRAIKDLIPRFQSMKGKDVLRKAGWDTHGLPVELEVEKLLGLDGKPQIEAYGICLLYTSTRPCRRWRSWPRPQNARG